MVGLQIQRDVGNDGEGRKHHGAREQQCHTVVRLAQHLAHRMEDMFVFGVHYMGI